ncbi:aminoglycoside phosphotransferase family protein [Candidatus Finniella inopinata]|uniref:Aminoglycoside phosphotransferase n=1 Tax=Candidatus Finniella inopinata TaxID=1696036 RepID=A0A4Q7DPU6_9PROT|nr:phosphotransferase [Candidatus Finniella inopinata]RZI47056.1 aminoglycoside phosphotransferase [Candidatus Finniella inopinata]
MSIISPSRTALRHQFLRNNDYQPEQLEFLANDMSLRQYFRLPQSQRILMDAPSPENPAQFIAIAHHLKELGLRTPGILGHHIEEGFVLLEDFGDQTFSKILEDSPQREASLYKEAVRVLKYLHQNGLEKPAFIADYCLEKLLTEVQVFMDWYWPAVETQTTYEIAKQDFLGAWRTVFSNLPDLPHRLVLRDYHVDNLMWLPAANAPLQQCGLLDFQDAVWGPVVYDFISLVEDARRDVSLNLQKSLWEIFLEEVPSAQQSDYRTAAAILGAGRHVKVIGVFTRYALRQGKPKYLCHLPRLWNYLKDSLQKPSLKPVHDWFEAYLPLHNQGIPSV